MLHKNAIKKTGVILCILCIVQFLFYKIFFQKSGDFSPKCGDFEIFLEWRFVAIFDSGGGDFCLKLSGHTVSHFAPKFHLLRTLNEKIGIEGKELAFILLGKNPKKDKNVMN